eukprot:GGOE01054573.1.p1 GENE.GGOE01054573.1~~GGOE01054573.1.p1  ORF type:complete len:590 (-),score=61.77 GGOE01054573.1:382-2151(-)
MQQEVDRLWRTDVQHLRQLLSTYHIEFAPSDERKSLIWKFLSVMRPESRVQLHMYLDFLEGLSNQEEAAGHSGGEDQQPHSKPPSDASDHKSSAEQPSEESTDGYQWYDAWQRHLREQQEPRQPPPEAAPNGQHSAFTARGVRNPYTEGGFAQSYPCGAQGEFPHTSHSRAHVIPPYQGQEPFPQMRRPPIQPPPPVPKVPDYYAMLEIATGCEAAAIKRAYRRLAMRYHPDKNPGDAAAEERFKAVKQAYEILTDEAQRVRYDAALERYVAWVKADQQYRAEAQYQLQFQAMLANPIIPLTSSGLTFPSQPLYGNPLRQTTSVWHSNAPRPKPFSVPQAWSEPSAAFAGAADSSRPLNSDPGPGRRPASPWQAPPASKTANTGCAQSFRTDPQEAYRVPEPSPFSSLAETCSQPRSRRMQNHSKAPHQSELPAEVPTTVPAPAGTWRPHFRHSPNASVSSGEEDSDGPAPGGAAPASSAPESGAQDGKDSRCSLGQPHREATVCNPAMAVTSTPGRRSRVGTAPVKLDLPAVSGRGSPPLEDSPIADPTLVVEDAPVAATAAKPPANPIVRPSKFRSLLNRFGLPFTA